MTDSDQHHRAVSKNGTDRKQDREIADLQAGQMRNDADHQTIIGTIADMRGELRTLRDVVREGATYGKLARWFGALLITGLGWFVVLTLQHIWSGERWGAEMRHDIDQNHDAIEVLQRHHGANHKE